MNDLQSRTWFGVAGSMLVSLAATSTVIWAPLGYLMAPGSLLIGLFYQRLSKVVVGLALRTLTLGWLVLAISVAIEQSGFRIAAVGILGSVAAVGLGYVMVALQPGVHPRPVWAAALIGLVVPILAVTAGLIFVVGSTTVGGVAQSSGVGFSVAFIGLVASQGIGSAIAAFGTDRVIRA